MSRTFGLVAGLVITLLAHPSRAEDVDTRADVAEAPRKPKRKPARDDGPDPMLVAGWLTGIVGLVGIGVGVGFAGHASSQWDDALALCPSKRGCSPEAVTLGDDAGTSADIGTGTIITGSALVATGAVLMLVAWLVEPAAAEVAIRF